MTLDSAFDRLVLESHDYPIDKLVTICKRSLMLGNEREKSNGPSLWRGAAGGLVGGLLGILILFMFHYKNVYTAAYWGALAMPYLLYYLPFTTIAGVLIGASAWKLTRLLRTRPLAGAFIGGFTGAIIGGVVGIIIDCLVAGGSQDSIVGGFFLKYGIIVGAVTGIISGSARDR